MGRVRGISRLVIGGAWLLCAVPAAAQFSDGYQFLKAVRDGDGNKATEYLNKPGAPALNARDPGTGETALHIVVKSHADNWVGFLLSKGANTEVKDKDGNTPLHDAAMFSDTTAATYLIGMKARVDATNSRGETPLILAVQRRDLVLARQLTDAGADPRLQDTVAGKSALDYAQDDARGQAMVKLLQDAKPAPKKAISGPVLH